MEILANRHFEARCFEIWECSAGFELFVTFMVRLEAPVVPQNVTPLICSGAMAKELAAHAVLGFRIQTSKAQHTRSEFKPS